MHDVIKETVYNFTGNKWSRATYASRWNVDQWLLIGAIPQYSFLDQQLVIIEDIDSSTTRYIYRNRSVCVELERLTAEHTAIMLSAIDQDSL
mgnify:CR=1 FL=1